MEADALSTPSKSFNSLYWVLVIINMPAKINSIPTFNSLYWVHCNHQVFLTWAVNLSIPSIGFEKRPRMTPEQIQATFNSLYWVRRRRLHLWLGLVVAFNSLYWVPIVWQWSHTFIACNHFQFPLLGS